MFIYVIVVIGWGAGLAAGGGTKANGFGFFRVTVDLSEQGLGMIFKTEVGWSLPVDILIFTLVRDSGLNRAKIRSCISFLVFSPLPFAMLLLCGKRFEYGIWEWDADTEHQSDHVYDIGKLLFQYLNMIKEDGIQEWIFDEVCGAR